jgi:type I restriction enzyme S subunit
MNDWKEIVLKEASIKITDGSHFSPKDQEEGYVMLSSKDMGENDFDYSDVKYISPEDYIKLVNGDCKPLKNDILIIKDGNSYLKRIFMCREEREQVVLSSIAIVRPDIKKVDPSYLTYFLKSERVKEEMAIYLSGAAIPRIILDDFKKVKIILPPLPIQSRIAEILGRYDALIDNCQRQISALESMAQEIYKEWFVRGRCPYAEPGEEGGLPVGWEVKTVERCFDIIGGGTPSREESNFWEDGTVNWFTPTDITGSGGFFLGSSSEKITDEGLNNSSARIFPSYSVMMTSRATIGAVAINTLPATTNQGFIVCLPNEQFSFAFIYLWIIHNKHIFEMLASGATFLEIPKGIFKKIEMIVPTETVLRVFDKAVIPVFKKIENLQTQLITLRQTRDALLPRLLSGQLETQKMTQE